MTANVILLFPYYSKVFSILYFCPSKSFCFSYRLFRPLRNFSMYSKWHPHCLSALLLYLLTLTSQSAGSCIRHSTNPPNLFIPTVHFELLYALCSYFSLLHVLPLQLHTSFLISPFIVLLDLISNIKSNYLFLFLNLLFSWITKLFQIKKH